MPKKNIEQEINDFLEIFDINSLISFLECSIPLTELYNVDENEDWVEQCVGEDQVTNVRIIRTVYLLSKLAEMHSGKLATIRMKFKDLWKRLEAFDGV